MRESKKIRNLRAFQFSMKWNRDWKKKLNYNKSIPSVTVGAFGKVKIPIIKYFKSGKVIKRVFKYKKGEMRRSNI